MTPRTSSDCGAGALEEACPTTGWKGRLARQFGKPEGRMGRLVGHAMSVRNAARSKWVVSLLDIEAVDRVLEIGFGSGRDLRRVASLATQGLTAGVDHSPEMVKMARGKSIGAILSGRADIRLGSADAIPFPDACFTKAFSINAIQFWRDRRVALLEVSRVLRPGGTCRHSAGTARRVQPGIGVGKRPRHCRGHGGRRLSRGAAGVGGFRPRADDLRDRPQARSRMTVSR